MTRWPPGSGRGTDPPTVFLVATGVEPASATVDVVVAPWTRNEHSAVAGLKTISDNGRRPLDAARLNLLQAKAHAALGDAAALRTAATTCVEVMPCGLSTITQP